MVAYVSPVVSTTSSYVNLYSSSGDYIKSPSGVYYATLLPNNAEFVVSQGTDPATSGLNVVWNTPAQDTTPGSPVLVFTEGDGSIRSFYPNNINHRYYDFGYGVPDNTVTTVSLADNGALTLNAGTNPAHPGQQTFSNNIDDPVVAYDLTGVKYDLLHPEIASTTQFTSLASIAENDTQTQQSYPLSLSLNYTKTSNWSFSLSEAITIGLKSSFDVGIPGIGDTKQEITLSSTTTFASGEGKSESNSKTFMVGGNIAVPPFTTYQTVLTGTEEMFDIPFTYTGVAQYQDGAMVPVDGSGVFAGQDTGIFKTVTTCVSTPGGCPTPPSFRGPPPVDGGTPVPEPSTLSLMSGAVLVLAALRRRLVRRARAPG